MSLFKRKKTEEFSYSRNDNSLENDWNAKYNLDIENTTSDDTETDEEDTGPYYEIKFNCELSNGCIMFLIMDDTSDDDAGYVILTQAGKVTVIPSGFYTFDDDDIKYLEDKAKKFYNALN